jgi:twinkle protein
MTATALNEVGIRLRRYTVGDHKVACPNCSHTRRKKNDPCLSVTIKPDGVAIWNCHHCAWTGRAGGEGFKPRAERRVYVKPKPEADPKRPEKLFEWFAKRGITRPTVEKLGIYRTRRWFPQTGKETDCIAFPYEWTGELRNVKYRDGRKNFVQERDAEPVLYNADSIKEGEDLIWVEGEMDVLAMIEAGYDTVVSLPNGAPANDNGDDEKRYEPLRTHADQLEKVKRVLIATDADGPGTNLANELARRLGKDKCLRVAFPEINDVAIKDPNECLVEHGKDVLRECITNATPWPIDGLYNLSIFEDAVLALYRGDGVKPLSTGFHEMDRAFKVLPGQFIVVTGIPNHGKSRWLDQVAVQMARLHGWKWCMFSPETGTDMHVSDICEIWRGQPFHVGPTYRMSEEELRDALGWANENIFFIDANDDTPSIDWILERAKAAVIRYGIRGLIIDPYNEVEASRPQHKTETEFVSQLISKCKRFARTHDVAVFMVVHPIKINSQGMTKEPIPGLYDMAGSAHWRNKADAGLVVYRDDDEGCSWVISRKIRRQPVCGRPGKVQFKFNGADRRFEDVVGSYTNTIVKRGE